MEKEVERLKVELGRARAALKQSTRSHRAVLEKVAAVSSPEEVAALAEQAKLALSVLAGSGEENEKTTERRN